MLNCFPMNLSLIIPAYNEAKRLPKTLEEIRVFFANASEFLPYEVIVVDDGSSDHTNQIAESFEDRMPVRCIRLAKNRGKGAAVRDGVHNAKGQFIFIYDADGATPIEDIKKLHKALLENNADIAIGSRVICSPQQTVSMSLHRRLVGRIYWLFTRPLIGKVKDAACGAKLFRAKAAQDIFSRQVINRFAFDVEVLNLAKRGGYQVIEVPVYWKAVPKSKVRLIRDGVDMFLCVIKIYLSSLRCGGSR